MMLKANLILIGIVLLAAVIRLPALGQFPNGFTGDEAGQGYSAYSILNTGEDEWGQFLPINPRGFGDFKPPLYTYLTVPFVAIFGLTVESVRFPAAILGILTVIALYFLSSEISRSRKVALWSAFLLAINPWHIQLSRTAFEGGAGVFLSTLGLLFFLKAFKKANLIYLSIIFLGLGIYSYHSFRLFIILLVAGLGFIYRKNIGSSLNKKQKLISILLISFFILPIILNIGSVATRASDVGIINQNFIEGYFKDKGQSPLPPVIDRVFDNKYLYIGSKFINNYLSYFAPSLLFTGDRSDGNYLNFPYFPLLYLSEIMFFYLAIFLLMKKKEFYPILLWVLLAPIPASLGIDSASANRAVTFLPILSFISGYGVSKVVERFRKIELLLVVLFFVSLIFFLRFYFINLPQRPPNNLRFGYDVVFKKVLGLESQYSNVVFSKVFTEPQIFIAFYGKFDPATFQKNSVDWLRYKKANKLYIDQLESWNLGKYLFEDINWPNKESKRTNTLVVSKPEDFPENIKSVFDFRNPKGEIIYRLVPTNQNF